MNNFDKINQLMHMTHEIAAYDDIIDLLNTQMLFYKNKKAKTEEALKELHANFLKPDNTIVETRQLKEG